MLRKLLSEIRRSGAPAAPVAEREADPRAAGGRAALAAGAIGDGLVGLARTLAENAGPPEVRRLLVAGLVDLARRDDDPAIAQKIAYLLGTALLALDDVAGATHCARIRVPSLPSDAEVHDLRTGPYLPEHCAASGWPVIEARDLAVEPMSGKGDIPAALRAAFVAAIPGARVLGTSFIPIAPDGTAFLERCVHRADKVEQFEASAVVDTVLLGSAGRLLAASTGTDRHAGPHVLLGSSDNIGHWLLNWFPRLMLARRIPGFDAMKVVVGDDLRAMHYECLDAAGIGRERVVALARGRLAAFDQLWVPSLLYGCVGGPTLSWHPGALDWVRRVLGAAGTRGETRRGTRRVFLSRAGTRWRRLVNEAEVLACVADLGFELVDPGTLSIAGQLEVAASASVIAGTMGAGMNLMMFAAPGTVVATIKGDIGGMMDIDPFLAARLGLRYLPVAARMVDANPDPLKRDLEADPEQVRAALRRTIEASG